MQEGTDHKPLRIDQQAYETWIAAFDSPQPQHLKRLTAAAREFRDKPLVSIVMPVYNTDPALLGEAIDSVLGQLYGRWELCIADDASSDYRCRQALDRYARSDSRIRITQRAQNGGIAAAANSALEMARGEWVTFLDHDDRLSPLAIWALVAEFNRHPEARLIYTDSDNLDLRGRRCNPYFKPGWNYPLLLAQNYFNHLTAYRHELLKSLGGLRTGFDGSQDYDLLLRALERIEPGTIRHVAHVLYHWRVVSSSFSRSAIGVAAKAARSAIGEHLQRRGLAAVVEAAVRQPVHNRVRWQPVEAPAVSLVFRSDHPQPLPQVAGLLRDSNTGGLEVREVLIMVATGHGEAGKRGVWKGVPVEVIGSAADESQAELWNRAMQQTTGEFVCLLDAGLQPAEPGWLAELLAWFVEPGTAVVAPRIASQDRIVSAGIQCCLGGQTQDSLSLVSSYAGSGCSERGYFGHLALDRAVSAVSPDSVLIRRESAAVVGGFDERIDDARLAMADLCLRLTDSGLATVLCASVDLLDPRAGNGPDAQPAAVAGLGGDWRKLLTGEVLGNPNLDSCASAPRLAFPPRHPRLWE